MPAQKELPPIPARLGPYVLGKRLGGGGMGDVYEASHIMMSSRRVAIKLLKPHLADQTQFVQRFLREISALGVVKAHANLVRAEFADIADNVPYLVMEYVEGVDLDQMLKKQGPFNVSDACNVICQAAAGLEAIHEAGLVHRDLKPSNLMLTKDGVVKILDLGLARLQMTEAPVDELTSANCVLGTMDYTAPEQADDARNVDIRADIYSLGCTIYKLLTGHTPYGEYTTIVQKIRAHANVAFPGLPAEVPLELQRIVAKMVAKCPADRFGDPTELAAALQPFCQGSTLKPVLTVQARGPLSDALQKTPASIAEATIGTPAAVTDPSLVRPPRFSRRVKVLTLTGALSAVGVVIALAVAAAWRNADNVARLRDMDDFATSQRHAIFDRPPVPLVWYHADGASSTKFDADRRMFNVMSPKQAVFGLGILNRPDFTFQVTIANSPLEHAGIFWGYRAEGLEPGAKACFQYLRFAGPVNKDVPFQLERARCTIMKAQQGHDEFKIDSSAIEDIPAPQAEMVVEITVRRHMLVAVKVNGVACPRLVTASVNSDYRDADYRGAFGTYTASYGFLFKDATLYLPPANN